MPEDHVQKQCPPYLGNRLGASLSIACSKETSSHLLLLQSMSCCSGVDDVSVLKRNKHQCALLPENCYQLLEDVTAVGFDIGQILIYNCWQLPQEFLWKKTMNHLRFAGSSCA